MTGRHLLALIILGVILRQYAHSELCLGKGRSATQDSSDAVASVTVQSNVSGALVYVDSMFLGTTPLDTIYLDPGRHVFTLLQPDHQSWLHSAIVETLTLLSTQHLYYRVTFPQFYHITSEPYGATVYLSDSAIGQTPVRLQLPSSTVILRVAKDGYREELLPTTPDAKHIHVVLSSLDANSPLVISPYLSAKTSTSTLPLFVTTGTTVLAGATAAYFKIQADKHYNEYRLLGSQGSLQKVREYDRISGIALATSELSFLLLTYLLLSR